MYMAREWEGEVMSKIKCFRKGVVKVLNIILDAKTSQNDYTRNTRRPIQVFSKNVVWLSLEFYQHWFSLHLAIRKPGTFNTKNQGMGSVILQWTYLITFRVSDIPPPSPHPEPLAVVSAESLLGHMMMFTCSVCFFLFIKPYLISTY